MAVHNFAGEPRRIDVEVDSQDDDCELDDLLREGLESHPLDDGSLTLDLEAHGYRWFRIHRPGENRI